jgi:hypothetical protein
MAQPKPLNGAAPHDRRAHRPILNRGGGGNLTVPGAVGQALG